jgi:hypothetical protein
MQECALIHYSEVLQSPSSLTLPRLSLVFSGGIGFKHVFAMTFHSLVPTVTLDPAPIEQLSTQTLIFSFSLLTFKHPWSCSDDVQSLAFWHVVPNSPDVVDSLYVSDGITGLANAIHSLSARITYSEPPTTAFSLAVNLQMVFDTQTDD